MYSMIAISIIALSFKQDPLKVEMRTFSCSNHCPSPMHYNPMRQFEAYSAGTGGLIHGRPVDDRTSFVCFSSSSPTKQNSKRNQNLVAIDIKTSLAI
jgi:hypothetical protein